MKLSDKPRWKITAVALVCIVGLLLMVGGSYAAYTRQAYQRGVARNRDTNTVNFTSNYMQLCTKETQENTYAVKNVVYGENEKNASTVSFDMYVYNYANGNTSLISQKDITYTMRIAFSDGAGTNYTVQCDKDAAQSVSNNVYEITKTLPGRTANENKYTISFPGSEIDTLRITATAVPNDTTMTNNQKLAAIMIPCTSTSTGTFRAEGSFIDKSSGNPLDYDAFNYEVSISGGKANAVLTWDANTFEIDQFFLQKIGKTVADAANGRLEFTMDQSDGTGDYLVTFYFKDKSQFSELPGSLTWSEMNKKITFTATQAE